jgi:uncharacterized protein with PIN domain
MSNFSMATPADSSRSGLPPVSRVGHSSTTQKRCPRCGMPLRRVRRTAADRLRSLLSPVRRYQCVRIGCQWEGTLRS